MTQLPPEQAHRAPRASTQAPANKGTPTYFADSNPPGYKIWVGDLEPTATNDMLRERIQATLHRAGLQDTLRHVVAVQVTGEAAESRASYVVITVADYSACVVTQLK